MIRHAVILAGGAGTRLWPASTRAQPKQFMKIVDGKTLLQLTVERALALNVERIVIVTHQSQAERVAEDISAVREAKERTVILSEPVARNTAPALALAARYLQTVGEADSTSIVMPADHVVSPLQAFVSDALGADSLADQGYLVTFGIRPTRPETGYGYIETSDTLAPGWAVHSFREKPDQGTAIHYLKAGNYYWNSGMFVYQSNLFLSELAENSPSIASALGTLSAPFPTRRVHGVEVAGDMAALSALYPALESRSVDYAVMEKSGRRAMIMSSFRWNDVGSWDEIASIAEEPGRRTEDSASLHRNDVPVVTVASEHCYIDSDLPVAVCGLDDVHVIVKNGMVLVCRRGESQLVKNAVEKLKDGGYERLL